MKEYITGHTIANRVRMRRQVHKGAFLVVEGPDDSKVFRALIDQEACVIVVALGKDTVLEALSILNSDSFSGALGIVDADFDRVVRESNQTENVLRTDGHDLECMLLSSSAFDKVLLEHGSADRVKNFVQERGGLIAALLAKAATPIGYLLMVSLENDYGLTFGGLSFRRFVDPVTLMIDVPTMIKAVLDKSQNHALNVDMLSDDMAARSQPDHDPWQISRGYDILCILSFALQRTLASRQSAEVATDVLRRELRLAYTTDDFARTRLYQLISEWEQGNGPYRVLSIV